MAERVVLNLRLHEDPSFNERAASLVGQGEAPVLDSSAELAKLAARVQGGLNVQPIQDTQLVELSYQSNNPELAARIANGYAEVFIEWGIENRTSTVGKASSFLSAQIETLRHEIEERQKQLNAYAGDSEFALDPDGEALIERRQTLERQYNAIVAERIKREASYSELQNLPPETVANTQSGGVVGELRSEIFLLESEYRSKLETFEPGWPDMVELKDSIDDKKEQFDRLVSETYQEAVAQARAELAKARREESTLEGELQKIAADARLQNSAALEYTNQRTYIETRRELLGELVKRQSETEVASRVQTSQESNVRIVDRAVVPGRPFKPSLQGGLSRALVLGLFFGVGIVLLLEYLDRTVKTPEELEQLLRLPTLAVIPDIAEPSSGYGLRVRYGRGGYQYGYGYGSGPQGANAGANPAENDQEIELLPHHSPRLAVSEAYRSLRTALLLSTADELRVVALTSAEPGEGKTATSANLAAVLAQLGRRVLILDGDLRRPRMHKVFKISNRVGLVSYLTAHIDIERIVFETPVPNLYVCPSGPIPPNPSELLASERMRELLDAVRERFDFVLVDTPPVLPVADAIILGTQTDGVVVCARAGVLLREDAKFCRERLGYSNLRLIGTVLNRYRTSRGRYQRKYRYYGVYEEARADRADSSAA
ncbi:MAG: polysaccharide biosynthesis tyrosine autokinase [Acidobacteriota bacterium]